MSYILLVMCVLTESFCIAICIDCFVIKYWTVYRLSSRKRYYVKHQCMLSLVTSMCVINNLWYWSLQNLCNTPVKA